MDQVQDTFTAKVTDVVNATTLTGEYQDQSLTLRLIGVAAPPEQYEESVVAVHREYLVDRSFTFQLDTQRQDEEGAYWVYLWYNDSTTYNAMLLQSGLCPLGDLSQNTALAQALTEDNQYAQEHFVGIYLDNFDPENYTYDQGTYDQILQTMRPQPLPEDALTAVMHTSMGDMTWPRSSSMRTMAAPSGWMGITPSLAHCWKGLMCWTPLPPWRPTMGMNLWRMW